jgi:hypothetical protein
MARRPIFQQEWWLQAASRGAVETVEVRWDAIKVGALSFVRNRHFGVFVSLRMPPYTRTAGPVLTLPQSSPVQSAINTRRVIAELVAALPRHDSLFLLLDPEDPTAFAFSVNGCAVAQQFTFRVPHNMPTSLIWSGMASSTRRLIRSVQAKLTVERHLNLDRYQALTNRDHPEAKSTHDFTALRCLFDEACKRDCITILSSVREDGVDVASVILVWDDSVVYYWLPQRDRQQNYPGANALLIWQAICFASERSLTLDFDGYNSVGTAHFLATFGVPPVVRPAISHENLFGLLRIALRHHPRVNGIRPDPTIKTSFKNARSSKPQPASTKG